MRRKLIQHGKSSLTISLPRKWVKEKNLQKGKEIEVEESKGKLLISAQKHYEPKRINIDVSQAQPMIRKIIGAAFKAGYDEVSIRFGSHQELKAVQELVREQFTGFEIISQTKDKIIVKSLSQISFQDFGKVLKRLFFVLNHMASEAGRAVEKNDFEWLRNTTLLKIDSDKAADYCRRAINLGWETELKRAAPLYTVVEQLEKAVDRYSDLGSYISGNKIKVNNKIRLFLKELSRFQEKFYNLFYKFEVNKMVGFGKEKERLQKKLDQIAKQVSKKERKVITLLDRILNLIFDLNGPLMTVYL